MGVAARIVGFIMIPRIFWMIWSYYFPDADLNRETRN